MNVKITSYQELQQQAAASQTRIKDLEAVNEELVDFIENAALPLHWVNGEGIITWANQAELTALGFDKDEYIGQPISKFHADQHVIGDILSRLKNNETLHNYRARLKCKDGTIKHVLISSNVLTRDGKFIHTRCFTRDITPIVLEEQRKNDFVSMVSHELKTPLTSILSYIQVMLSKYSKSDDTFLSQALSRTESLAKSMTKMINDFLNMSRLEEAKVTLNLERLELHLLIQQVIQEIQLNSHTHNIQFSHSGIMYISADHAKLGQVLINLISNAIKYSPESSTITVGYEPYGTQVKIYVRDQGIGIQESDQKRLFERFYRVENHATKHTTGFGIGLYLVAEILRYHHTKIEVESSAGKGSTFYFLLPIKAN
ncbi:PAS domain-containing sensor histidine kinase [Pedobacter metabolipauper]|uniref:histidine kinase n=1 Tax=Pedobacter metabolipauper TaxID=425513 RepID=A0A4R6SZP4_9SPHI|nr:ATP-binding protein [Pedobacter metabolipauper]TDQ11239.1 PAS domain S-box-containing protein [Pedobacter metabolipauper]